MCCEKRKEGRKERTEERKKERTNERKKERHQSTSIKVVGALYMAFPKTLGLLQVKTWQESLHLGIDCETRFVVRFAAKAPHRRLELHTVRMDRMDVSSFTCDMFSLMCSLSFAFIFSRFPFNLSQVIVRRVPSSFVRSCANYIG